MPKISGLPEDTSPTTDDYSVNLDNGTTTLKKAKWLNIISMIAAGFSSNTVPGSSLQNNSVTPAQMLGVDVMAYDSALDGTPPTAGTGQFYMQCGTFTGTPSSSSLPHAFPSAFPNGLIMVVCQEGDFTNGSLLQTISQSRTGFTVRTPTSNSIIRVNYIAVGF